MTDGDGHEGVGETSAGVASCSAPGWRSMGGTATAAGRRPRRGSPSLEGDGMREVSRIVEEGRTARE